MLLALLFTPGAALAAVLTASAMHEGAHLLLLCCFCVPAERIRLSALGAEISASGLARLSYGRELAVTLAGPLLNLLLAPPLAALSARLGWEWGTMFAGAHVVLGAFNLLPVPPLDGGRALYLACAYFLGPDAGERIALAAGLTVSLSLSALALYLTAARGLLGFLLLAALGLLAGALRQVALARGRRSV